MKQKPDPAEVPGVLGPLFGRTDPQTSREAAERMAVSQVKSDQTYALMLIQSHPGQTCPELALWATDGREDESLRQKIGRRLNELEKAGLIYRNGVRDGCSIWFPSGK